MRKQRKYGKKLNDLVKNIQLFENEEEKQINNLNNPHNYITNEMMN